MFSNILQPNPLHVGANGCRERFGDFWILLHYQIENGLRGIPGELKMCIAISVNGVRFIR